MIKMTALNARFAGRAPLMANMVEGGKTPILPADELQVLGYDLVIFPGGLMRELATTAGEYLPACATTALPSRSKTACSISRGSTRC